MRTSTFFIGLLLSLLSCFTVLSQNKTEEFSVLFYNVENYFDTRNDTLTEDNEFLPNGIRGWNYSRFQKKTERISKTIINAAGWNPPQLIALCEIENRFVLNKLVQETALKSFGYQIIHKESSDTRGIDVALLYNPTTFYPLFYRHYPIKNKDNSCLETREILHVCGLVNNYDTLHMFVNHWPSRYSGLLNSELLRILAAETLADKVKEIFSQNEKSKVVVVGDFNDQPTDKSIYLVLQAREIKDSINTTQLYNLSFNWQKLEIQTLKYQSQWNVFDQVFVSGTMLRNDGGIYCEEENAKIIQLPFLLEPDEKYGGQKPKRTYVGYNYNDGFSDHLPIILQIKSR